MNLPKLECVICLVLLNGCYQASEQPDDEVFVDADLSGSNVQEDSSPDVGADSEADAVRDEPPWGDGPCFESPEVDVIDNAVIHFSPAVSDEHEPLIVAAAQEEDHIALLLESQNWLCLTRLDAELNVVETHNIEWTSPGWPVYRPWHVETRTEGTLFIQNHPHSSNWLFLHQNATPTEVVTSPDLFEEDFHNFTPLPFEWDLLVPLSQDDEILIFRWLGGLFSGRANTDIHGIYPEIFNLHGRHYLRFHRASDRVEGPYVVEVSSDGTPIGEQWLLGDTGYGNRLVAAPLEDRVILAWTSSSDPYRQEQITMVVDQSLEPISEPTPFDSRWRLMDLQIATDEQEGIIAYFDQHRCCEDPTDVVVRPIDEQGRVGAPCFSDVRDAPWSLSIIRVQNRWFVLWIERWNFSIVRLGV